MKPRPLGWTFALCVRGSGRDMGVRLRPGLGVGSWNGKDDWRTEQGKRRWASTRTTAKTSAGHGSGMAVTRKQKPTTTSTTVPTKPSNTPPPPPPSVPILRAKTNLNPPLFTYAPDLQIPARKSDQTLISHLWTTGRAYIAFYKAGISNVRQTASVAKKLRAKVSAANKPATQVLTRAEWQITLRSKADMIRLPGFGLLVLLLGEWLPLVVIYITPLIPEPCRIPQQVLRARQKDQDRRHARLRAIARGALSLQARDLGSYASAPDAARPESLYELLAKSARFACHSPAWDVLGLTPPKWLLRRNVRRKLEYIKTDDRLVERDGGWAACEKREIERACEERGIDVLGKREDELRKDITEWSRKSIL